MKKYQNKFLWRNIFYSNFTIFILIIFVLFVLNGLANLYSKYESTRNDLSITKKEELEEKQKLTLEQNKLNEINTDAGKDKYIRNTYPVKKEGENLIIVYDAPSSTYEIPKGDSFFEHIKNLFLDLFGR